MKDQHEVHTYRLICLSICLLLTFSFIPLIGQSILKDICPGGCGANPTNLTTIGSTMYFSATNGQSGAELWKTNGTSAGTVLIKDINAGKPASNPGQFTLCNGKVFFTAATVANGEELWITDGTAANSKLIKDIWPGTTSSNIQQMVAIGNFVYFVANNGVNGAELWRSDGVNTILLKDFRIGAADGCVVSMANYQNKLYFTRNLYSDYRVDAGQLWKYDPSTNKFSTLFEVKNNCLDDLTTHIGNLYYGAGDYMEYVSIYRLNPDQKGGTYVAYSTGYILGWMKSTGGKLAVAGGDEYNSYSAAVLDGITGTYTEYLGDGVRDVAVAKNKTYYGSRYWVSEKYQVQDYSDIRKGEITLATYKGLITDVESLGNYVIYSAYTSSNGNELRFINAINGREGVLEEEAVALKLYPNPASSQTTLAFSAQETGLVDVDLYDMRGNKLQTLFEGEMNAGESRQQQMDATPFANGMYFVRMTNGKQMQYQKLTIAK